MKMKSMLRIMFVMVLILVVTACGNRQEELEGTYTEIDIDSLSEFVDNHGNYAGQLETTSGRVGSQEGLVWAEYVENGDTITTIRLYADTESMAMSEIKGYFFDSINLLGAGSDANLEDVTLLLNDLDKLASEGEYLLDGHRYVLSKLDDIYTLEISLLEEDKENTFSSQIETSSVENVGPMMEN